MRYLTLAGLCVALAGCQTQPIYLRDMAGRTVTCGPYRNDVYVTPGEAVQRESQCIGDYQRQGYERIPSP